VADRTPPAEGDSISDARQLVILALLGAIIGIPAALVAAAFFALVHALQHLLWTELPANLGYDSPPWFLVLGLPVAGAVLVVLARRFLPGDGGAPPLRGLESGPTPVAYAPGIALAALGTLAFGAVLGPEMPVIALGSVVGMLVAARARVPQQGTGVLAMAGSFSAISALFGGPLVAGMLLLEGGLAAGARLLHLMVPGLVAAAIGYTIFVGLGSWGGLGEQSLAVPDLATYTGTSVVDLAWGLVVGLAAAAAIVAIRRLAVAVDDRASRAGMAVALIGGGLAVGLLALAGGILGADPQDVLFSGQASIPVLVGGASTSVVLVLLAAKGLAYAISLGAGFRGGPIFPAVFIGVALASLGVTVAGMSPTLAIAVGSSAGMAAQTRLLISPLLFAALLVGPSGADAMPAAVLAAVSAWILVGRLDPAPARRGV
jgi:H+/Cl- antiporter ClcA